MKLEEAPQHTEKPYASWMLDRIGLCSGSRISKLKVRRLLVELPGGVSWLSAVVMKMEVTH